MDARVLLDLGATHSFISLSFSMRIDQSAYRLKTPLSMSTPISDEIEVDIFYPSYLVFIEGKILPANLIVLHVMDFDVILGMDWLARHYATIDCRAKKVIFRIPG